LALALITCQTPTTDSKLKRTNNLRTFVTLPTVTLCFMLWMRTA